MSLNGAIAEAVVLIRADGTTFQNDVVHQGTTAGVRAGSAFGENFKRRAKATLAIGGAALFAGVTAGLRTGFGELTDYEAGLSQLRAGLKSTKGVVGLTSKEMENLASKIQNYSGQTDDSIVKTESLLLTFTNIHDQAGKNNDIFTRTTEIAADMAQRLGTDASGAAVQLGKALNDPVKGLTALTRVGVSFDAQQVKAIQTAVKHSNVLRAQKIELHELNTEFGGSARLYGQTLPGQLDRTKRAYEDITQELATDVLPYALDFSKWIRKDAIPALEDFGGWVKEHKTELEWFAGIFAGVAVSVKALRGLRSIQSLLGRGALGGGGLLGGAVSMAKPVPVFVTNPGGLPGTGGKGPTPVGGKTPWWKSALPAPAVLAAAYFGTSGGDQAPGQGSIVSGDHGIVGQKSAVNYSAQMLAKILGNNVSGALNDNGSFKVLDTGKAVGLIETQGTKEQIAALKDLAGRYDNVRAALAQYKKGVEDNRRSQAQLNDILGVTKGKVDEADSAARHFSTTLFGLSKNALTAGRNVGIDFGQGMVDGLHSKDGEVRQAAEYQASLLEKYSRLAIDSDSPSKVARRIGQDWDDGLLAGLRDKQNDINKQISGQMGQLGNLRGRAQALASGVTGAILGDSSILNTPDQTVGGLKSYFHHVLNVDRRFTHRVDRLRNMHVRKGLVNELEQAGPIAAGNLIRQLVRADRGDRHDVARLYGNIHDVARGAGQTARQETYDPQIRAVVDELKGLRDDLHNVTREIRGAEHRASARTHH